MENLNQGNQCPGCDSNRSPPVQMPTSVTAWGNLILLNQWLSKCGPWTAKSPRDLNFRASKLLLPSYYKLEDTRVKYIVLNIFNISQNLFIWKNATTSIFDSKFRKSGCASYTLVTRPGSLSLHVLLSAPRTQKCFENHWSVKGTKWTLPAESKTRADSPQHLHAPQEDRGPIRVHSHTCRLHYVYCVRSHNLDPSELHEEEI